MVESLFRDLRSSSRRGAGSKYEEYQRLQKEMERVEKALMADKEYRKLRDRKDRAYSEWYNWGKELQTKVENLYRKYLANGVTDKVLKELDALVEIVNN